MTLRKRLFYAMTVAILVLASCDGEAPPPGELDVGLASDAHDFVALADHARVPVVLGANGLNMIVPSLRAYGINPSAPDPTVQVEVGGILMAADIEGARVDMEVQSDGGYVLWELRVPFQTDLCCYNCAAGKVSATLRDASGRTFVGEVTIELARDSCPAPAVCCGDANACPDPSLTQLCP